MDEAHRVREFWFGRLPLSADALNRRLHFWFAGPPSELGRLRDEHIRERFGELLELAASGALASWEDGPRHRARLRLRHRSARPHTLGHAVRRRGRARSGRADVLLHALAARREPRGTG